MTYMEVLKKTAADDIGTATFNTLESPSNATFIKLFGMNWNKILY